MKLQGQREPNPHDINALFHRLALGLVLGLPGFALGLPSFALGLPGFALGLPGFMLGLPGLALGLPGFMMGLPGFMLGLPGLALGPRRLLRYQHDGIGNMKVSHWGYCPTHPT